MNLHATLIGLGLVLIAAMIVVGAVLWIRLAAELAEHL